MSPPLDTEVRRARPLLGTYVEVTVAGADRGELVRAAGAALDAVAAIGNRLSFHDPQSLLARLMREAHRAPVEVDGTTYRLLRRTLSWARRTSGSFDPVRAALRLVEAGLLPAPRETPAPDPRATWADVTLDAAGRVRFRRPLWLDLGGIAKGFAVDRAVATLRRAGVRSGCVNAGGDLRVFGERRIRVGLRDGESGDRLVAFVELAAAALASSSACFSRRGPATRAGGSPATAVSHLIDTLRGGFFVAPRGASAVAPSCLAAEVLAKMALFAPHRAAELARSVGGRLLPLSEAGT